MRGGIGLDGDDGTLQGGCRNRGDLTRTIGRLGKDGGGVLYQDAALDDIVLAGTGADIEVGLALGKRARGVGGGNDAQVEAHALGKQAGDIGVVAGSGLPSWSVMA